jgi:hypothetical protein
MQVEIHGEANVIEPYEVRMTGRDATQRSRPDESEAIKRIK